MIDGLRAALGTDVVGEHAANNEMWLRVELSAWRAAAEAAKAHGFTYFSFLSAIDWQPNPDLDGEYVYDVAKEAKGIQPIIDDPVIRVGGGTSRFQVFGRLYDTHTKQGVIFLADVTDALAVPSWTPYFAGADWHERETWEMFGIEFLGHPGLRHIYLPAEFEGYPLRKDFPLLAREVRPWPGLVDMEEMPLAASDEGAPS